MMTGASPMKAVSAIACPSFSKAGSGYDMTSLTGGQYQPCATCGKPVLSGLSNLPIYCAEHSADGSPDLGARPDALARFRAVMGCGIHGKLLGAGGPHFEAVHLAGDCDDCLSLLVAAIRAETIAEAARIAEGQYGSDGTSGYDVGYDAAARYIEAEILALIGSQTPNA